MTSRILAVAFVLGLMAVPTIVMVFHITMSAARGRDVGQPRFPARPASPRRKRTLRGAIILWGSLYIASILWAVYVFGGKGLFITVAAAMGAVVALIVLALVAPRLFGKLPEVPQEGFKDEAGYQEWKNKAFDDFQAPFAKKFAILLLVLISLMIALGIAMTVMAVTGVLR